MWKFCMKHPGMRDVGDVAAKLFPAFPRTAREITSAMLIINSVLTMGYHIFTGGKSESTPQWSRDRCQTASMSLVPRVPLSGVALGVISCSWRTQAHREFS